MENELEDENEDRDICVKCKRVWEHCYCGQKEEIEEIEDRAQLLVEKIKRHVDAVKVGSFGEMYPIIRLYAEEAFSSHTTYWKERVRKEKLGWEGYVVVDPQSNNYKCSPIFSSVKEAEKWRRDFGESALKVATVDVILKN